MDLYVKRTLYEWKNLQSSQEAYILDIKFQLEYLLFSPKSYGQSAAKKWPLIVSLHGARERGNDLDQLKNMVFQKSSKIILISHVLQYHPSVLTIVGGAANLVYSTGWQMK